jgi:beta-glucosidase-like glycosyl hydrolase
MTIVQVAATWNVSAMQEYSAAMANEQRLKGTNVMLAPMVNLARVPQAGQSEITTAIHLTPASWTSLLPSQ